MSAPALVGSSGHRIADGHCKRTAPFDGSLPSNWEFIPDASSLMRPLQESPFSPGLAKIFNSICPIPATMA
jgi:hypothetical protein